MLKIDAPIHAEGLPDLVTVGRLRVRADVCFANAKGVVKSGRQKDKEKLLAKLQEPLERLLEPDEAVLLIAKGQNYMNVLEQWSYGIFIYTVGSCVLVLTNQRFIALRTNSSQKWEQAMRVCRWQDISRFNVKGFLSRILEIKFTDGSSESFWRLDGTDAKIMALIGAKAVEAARVAAPGSARLASVCPVCLKELTAGTYECAGCHAEFKNERTMIRLAFLPMAAYFYCKKPLLGIVDLFAEGIALLVVLILLANLVSVALGSPWDPGDTVVEVGASLLAGLLILGFEVAITILHCRRFIRDFIPTGKKVALAHSSTNVVIG